MRVWQLRSFSHKVSPRALAGSGICNKIGRSLYELFGELGKLVDKKTANMRKWKLRSWRKTFVSGLVIRKDSERKIVQEKGRGKHTRKGPLTMRAGVGSISPKVQIFCTFNIHLIRLCLAVNSPGTTVDRAALLTMFVPVWTPLLLLVLWMDGLQPLENYFRKEYKSWLIVKSRKCSNGNLYKAYYWLWRKSHRQKWKNFYEMMYQQCLWGYRGNTLTSSYHIDFLLIYNNKIKKTI